MVAEIGGSPPAPSAPAAGARRTAPRSRSCRSPAARRRAPNSKNPKRPRRRPRRRRTRSRSRRVPVSASSEPAWAPNASGSSSCDGDRLTRTAITTTTGTSAATDPLTLISAVSSATSAMVRTISRVRLSPADAISRRPAHAVTPVASSASLTTNSDAMKITVGSPKPASACCRSSTPVAHSASATATAVIAVGMTPDANATTAAASTRYVMVASVTRPGRRRRTFLRRSRATASIPRRCTAPRTAAPRGTRAPAP